MRPDVEPVGARVIVLPLEEPETTAAGLVLPDEVRQGIDTRRGMIVAVGPGFPQHGSDELRHTPLPLEVGWEIAYQLGRGARLELRDDRSARVEQLLVLEFGEVLAVLSRVS